MTQTTPQAKPTELTTNRFTANLIPATEGAQDSYNVRSKKEGTLLVSVTKNGVWHVGADFSPFIPMSYFVELNNFIVNLNEILRAE